MKSIDRAIGRGVLVAAAGASLACGSSASTAAAPVAMLPSDASAPPSDTSAPPGDVSVPPVDASVDASTHDDGGDASLGSKTDAAPAIDAGASTPGCASLTVQAGASVEGSTADTFAWRDVACLPRTASLLRNDATDAFGEHGGYLRSMSYVAAGKTRNIKGTGANGWQGFGYIINHGVTADSDTTGTGGTTRTVLAGRHHALHEFTWRVSIGGPVKVTARWMFATGRSNPLFAITLDSSANAANVVQADTRAPYGDLAWDDGAAGDVSGDGWGDSYKFATTGAGPVTPTSAWDYTQPNIVPYVLEWSTPTDAEMGLVATLPWAVSFAGGDYGGGLLLSEQGKKGSALLTDIPDWEWPYQLNQYELPYVTSSHRVAWGATYGAVGESSYTSFGHTLSGYPYQSYSVYVVLGLHSTSAVAAQVAELEAVQGVSLTATAGTVATDGAAGLARTDRVTFTPRGWDPVYGAFALDASSNAIAVTLNAGAKALRNPLFEVRGYMAATPPATVSWNGQTLVADDGYFATVDPASQTLWVTLNASLSGTGVLAIH